MKPLIFISFFLFFLQNSFAQNKVLYGRDNRVDVTSKNPFYDIALSTAAMIKNSNFKHIVNEKYPIENDVTLGEALSLCPNENFQDQFVIADCSGTLVASNIIVTAGHCVQREEDCQGSRWVFNYNKEGVKDKTIKVRDVYRCQKILKQKLDSSNGNDYSIILLDRPVLSTTPVDFRVNDKIKDHQSIVVIGHPTGMPTKIAAGANVFFNKKEIFFYANLDTFGGNSGSGVFNTQTKKLEGILVRGATDYIWDEHRGCQNVNRCKTIIRKEKDHRCYGEDVTRITNLNLGLIIEKQKIVTKNFFNALKNELSLDDFIDGDLSPNIFNSNETAYEIVIKKDNLEQFKELALMKNFNINFPNKSFVTPLIYAVKNKSLKMISFLTSSFTRTIQKYRDINLNAQDILRNSALHYAVKNKDIKSVKLLINAGIDISLENKNGKSASDIAKELSFLKIYDLLNSK